MRAAASWWRGEVGAQQALAHVERGLVGRRHEHDIPPHHVGRSYGRDTGCACSRATACRRRHRTLERAAARPARAPDRCPSRLARRTRRSRARRARERHRGIGGGHGSLVRARGDGAGRGDHADAAGSRGRDERERTPGSITRYRHSYCALQVVERGGRGVVARDHDQLRVVLVEQVLGDLVSEAAHLVERPGSVRIAAGVADVDHVLIGKQVDDGSCHRESAEPESNIPIGRPSFTGHQGRFPKHDA